MASEPCRGGATGAMPSLPASSVSARIPCLNLVGSLPERRPTMRSLKNRVKQILMIGSYGVEQWESTWKVRGHGSRIGQQFTVWQESPGKWRVNGTNSEGSRRRERFPATSLGEA